MLDRIGDEVARATSIVRDAPASHFSAHTHGGGEEFLMLDGVFQDEHGDYPAGSYIRNPGAVGFSRQWYSRHQARLGSREPNAGVPTPARDAPFSPSECRVGRLGRCWKPGARRRASSRNRARRR
jgi:hypothetical protein